MPCTSMRHTIHRAIGSDTGRNCSTWFRHAAPEHHHADFTLPLLMRQDLNVQGLLRPFCRSFLETRRIALSLCSMVRCSYYCPMLGVVASSSYGLPQRTRHATCCSVRPKKAPNPQTSTNRRTPTGVRRYIRKKEVAVRRAKFRAAMLREFQDQKWAKIRALYAHYKEKSNEIKRLGELNCEMERDVCSNLATS